VPLTASQMDAARLIISDLSELAGLAGPHSIGIPGSGDNPLLQLPPNFVPEPLGNGPNVTYNYQPLLPPGPAPPQNPQNPINPTTTTASNVFIWSSPNNQIFPNVKFWNLGASPASASDIVVILTGTSQYTENFTFFSLAIDGMAQNNGLPPGELDMTGGGLTVTNGLDVAGTLLLQGDPPTFTSYGTSTVESTGQIIAQGAGTVVEFMPDPSNPNPASVLVNNFGLIAAESGGQVTFHESLVTNEAAATGTSDGAPQPAQIESIGSGSLVLFEDGTTLANGGKVIAEGGTVEFLHAGTVTNDPGSNSGGVDTAPGEIESVGGGSSILFIDTELDNFGGVSAEQYGTITFSDSTIVNEAGVSSGESSLPGGEIEATNDGLIGINGGKLVNEAGASLDAKFGGLIDISSAEVDNNQGAFIGASHNAEIDLFDTTLNNEGTLAAEDHSRIVVGDFGSGSVTNLGMIEALDSSTVLFIDVADTNYDRTTGQGDGVIAAIGCGAVVELLSTRIAGGTLETRDGGAIEIISPEADQSNIVVFDGSGQAVTIDGFVQVEPGATLELVGTINNDGTIDVDSATAGSDLTVDGTVELRGSGVVTLDGAGDEITGVGSDPLLENYSNVAGSGTIGGGGLMLINEATGTIDADGGRFRSLVIDTGENTITNDGLMEAACYSVLAIESQLDNFGRVIASSGDVVFAADLLNESGGYVGSILGGAVTLDDIKITNNACALIDADGACSTVSIAYDVVDNGGLVAAKNGGGVFVVDSSVDNTGGTFAADGWGSVIDLSNVLISQGNLETSCNGLIQTVCGVSTLSDVSISGDLAVGSGTTLILDDGTTMDSGVIFVAKGATLDIEASTGATLSGVTIINDGTVNVDCDFDTSPVTLTLDNASTVFGGMISIGNSGTLAIGNGGGMLDGVDVDLDAHGNIVVGTPAQPGLLLAVDEETQVPGAILTLDDGTKVSGGMLTVEHDAELQIEHGVRGPGATLDGVNVNDFGVIQVDAPSVATVLMLTDGTELSGGGLLSVGPSGLVDIESAWGAIFNGIDVDLSGHGNLVIGLDSVSKLTIAQSVDFDGSGAVTLDNQYDSILGSGHGATLDNDVAIQGEGTIGGPLELVNEASGVIDADIAGRVLTVHTGDTLDNIGTLEASHGGILQIDDPVQNFGGNALIEGGVLEFVSTTNVNHITFDNGIGTPSYGELILDDLSAGYSATIDGFSGKEGDLGHSDAIDLAHVQRSAISYSEHGGNTTVTIQEGHDAVAVLTLDGFTGDLDLDSDGHGGTLITDPPPTSSADAGVASPVVSSTATTDGDAGTVTFADADPSGTPTATVTPESSNDLGQFSLGALTDSDGSASVEFNFNGDQVHLAPGQTLTQSYNVGLTDTQNPAADQSQTVSVTIGGAGHDNFVFTPGVGADTVLNFNPQQDTIELDHFTNVQTVQELQSLITTDIHGDAVINLGNHDSVTLADTTSAQLQQAIQAGHVILH
jgi:hypothetical protein